MGYGRSGKIYAKHDAIIVELLSDPDYHVCGNGFVWTCIEQTGKRSVRGFWRKAGRVTTEGYVQISYKRTRLAVHRIIHRKFKGYLKSDLVVDHIDRNRSNNHPDNLRLVTQRTNLYYWQKESNL
jgi:hypothetical protein